jgi:hypothetical protein
LELIIRVLDSKPLENLTPKDLTLDFNDESEPSIGERDQRSRLIIDQNCPHLVQLRGVTWIVHQVMINDKE